MSVRQTLLPIKPDRADNRFPCDYLSSGTPALRPVRGSLEVDLKSCVFRSNDDDSYTSIGNTVPLTSAILCAMIITDDEAKSLKSWIIKKLEDM